MLEIKNLKTRFNIYDGVVKALEGVNLEVKEGESEVPVICVAVARTGSKKG